MLHWMATKPRSSGRYHGGLSQRGTGLELEHPAGSSDSASYIASRRGSCRIDVFGSQQTLQQETPYNTVGSCWIGVLQTVD